MGRGDSQASEITALPAQHRQRGRRRTAQKQAGDRRSYADFLGSVANPWTQRSFELANAPGYLDRLHLIYPMQDNEERKLSEEDWAEIEAAYEARDDERLIRSLLERAPRFPVADSFIGMLRRYGEHYLDRNPKTIERIARRLYLLSKAELRAGCERPAAASRQLGASFRDWLQEHYEVKGEEEFIGHVGGACVLAGTDAALADFARRHLGYRGNKGLDAIVKAGHTYMPIEAKLITDAGGGQTHQLKDALSIRGRGFHPDVEPIAVVDGHCLIFSADAVADPRRRVPVGRNAQMIAASKQPVVSALVLPRLIAERLQRSQGKRLLARGPGKAAARR